jgi:hypothetical protein
MATEAAAEKLAFRVASFLHFVVVVVAVKW